MGAPACRRGRDGISHSIRVGRRKERVRKGDLPLISYTSSSFQTKEFRTYLHKHEGSMELVIPFIFHSLNMECPSQSPVLLHLVLGWWQFVEAVDLQEVGSSWREGVTEAGALRCVAQPYFTPELCSCVLRSCTQSPYTLAAAAGYHSPIMPSPPWWILVSQSAIPTNLYSLKLLLVGS